ncbi:ABC transporter ATP-binding protein [uncultured Roseibium sp.]|uniref:ABC transporter ATP-binding protein n=1 Tax=uncultured Roseibium sp. TaxID=1936171 RepID=UPI0032174FB4
MTDSILEISGLTRSFGGLIAVNKVDLTLPKGRLHAVIGPNGAGKTTFFNLISGFLKPDTGKVIFNGKDITGLKSHRISQMGLARTLQIKSVFPGMTVEENIWIAAQSRRSVFRPFVSADSISETRDKVEAVLTRTGLLPFAKREAGTLSYGDVALLEIGIALATEPKLLLLDEPVCGMSPAETNQTVERIKELSSTCEIVIIEHDMEVVFEVADDITVMAQGSILAQGTPKQIAEDAHVRAVYLGEEDEDLEYA